MVTTSVIGKDLLSLIDLYRSLAKNDKPPPIKKSRTFTEKTMIRVLVQQWKSFHTHK